MQVVGETDFELENVKMVGSILIFELENEPIFDYILILYFQNAGGWQWDELWARKWSNGLCHFELNATEWPVSSGILNIELENDIMFALMQSKPYKFTIF